MIYLVGIDTLNIGFYVARFLLSEEEQIQFERRKELAKSGVFKSNSGCPIELRGFSFDILAKGSPPYTYILQSDDLTVKIARRPSNKMFPEVFIEFRSQFLWRYGYREAFNIVEKWVEGWAGIISNVVSRGDLCADVSGKHQVDLSHVVSRARKVKEHFEIDEVLAGEEYYLNKRPTGLVIGSGPCLMRIYDKTLQVGKSGNSWFMELWKATGWDGVIPVTRVEAQLRRDFFKRFDITTHADFIEHLPDIYQYMVEEWVSVRQPIPDANCSRWPEADFWKEVQGAYNQFGNATGILTKQHINEARLERLLPQVAGGITSLLALSDGVSFDDLKKHVEIYHRGRGTTVENAIEMKRKRREMI